MDYITHRTRPKTNIVNLVEKVEEKMKQGVYLITYQPKIMCWGIHYLNGNSGEHELGVVTHRPENYLQEEYSIYLDAVDSVSAFVRGCNLIRDKVEGR